jgi:hypothetical protein
MFSLEGGGSTISTGVAGVLGPLAYNAIIEQGILLADQPGDVTIDFWRGTLAEYLAETVDSGDSITGAAPLTISADNGSVDDVLTGWDTVWPAGSVLIINVDDAVDITRVSGSLVVRRTT